MNEVSEMWKEHNKARQEQHQEWYIKNMNALKKSGLKYTHKDTVCLFRLRGKPFVDFYPHTGRWRIVGKDSSKKVYTGGGNAFIHWYAKQDGTGNTNHNNGNRKNRSKRLCNHPSERNKTDS